MTETEMAVEIGKLVGLDLFALRERWRNLYGSEPPQRMSRELLTRAIAYRMQEEAFGGLSRAARAKLVAASEAPTPTGRPPRVRKDRTIKPGTKFLREWKGWTHEVMAMADGRFAYAGETYRSLTAIAEEITGTHWSGPTFFGLEPGKRDRPRAGTGTLTEGARRGRAGTASGSARVAKGVAG